MQIDTITYNKPDRIPYNPTKQCGYQPRPVGRLPIRSIIVHTTNGAKGSSLASEANYIANSRAISSHYLIGKGGEVIQFLEPNAYIAYHAGCVKATAYSNPFSIGIEMHNTPLEGACTAMQLQALDQLTRLLIEAFDIESGMIETHRNVAVYCADHPQAGHLGRKIDPSGFPDEAFYRWTKSLFTPPEETNIFRVIAPAVNVRTSPKVATNNIAGQLSYNDTFLSTAIKEDENGQVIKGVNTWAHLTQGTHNNQSVDGLGFVHMSNLIKIG